MKYLIVILLIAVSIPAIAYDPNCDAVCEMQKAAAEAEQVRSQRELEYLRREAEQRQREDYDVEMERKRQETIDMARKHERCYDAKNCD